MLIYLTLIILGSFLSFFLGMASNGARITENYWRGYRKGYRKAIREVYDLTEEEMREFFPMESGEEETTGHLNLLEGGKTDNE